MSDPTEMIQIKPFGDRPNSVFIGEAMRLSTYAVVDSEPSVTALAQTTLPEPTFVFSGNGDLLPEADPRVNRLRTSFAHV